MKLGRRNISIAVVVLVVLAAGTGIYLGLRGNGNSNKGPAAATDSQSQATTNQGGVVDNNASGSSSSSPSTSQPTGSPTSSTSGLIMLNQPTAGGLLKSGTTISGTASGLSMVQYRIKDPALGVIAQGQLSVSNGAYSGTASYSAQSSTGTLEIFDFNASTGAEENSIKINVSFK